MIGQGARWSLRKRLNPQVPPCFPSGHSEADKEKSNGCGRWTALTLRKAGVVMLRHPVGGRQKGKLEALRQCRLGSNKTEPLMWRKSVIREETGN